MIVRGAFRSLSSAWATAALEQCGPVFDAAVGAARESADGVTCVMRHAQQCSARHAAHAPLHWQLKLSADSRLPVPR